MMSGGGYAETGRFRDFDDYIRHREQFMAERLAAGPKKSTEEEIFHGNPHLPPGTDPRDFNAGGAPPAYQPPAASQPPAYQPPAQQPPAYQPPAQQPPAYQPPAYTPPPAPTGGVPGLY